MKYMIDEEALKAYLEKELNLSVVAEEKSFKGKQYEEATWHRERRYVLGNLLLMITGDEHFDPVTVDKGGFMKPMTNLRELLNSTGDEELADTLSPIFTIKDGKLVDCDGSWCDPCPAYDLGESCKEGIRAYMLKEAE